MKQTSLFKFSRQIKKLARFLFFSVITISVWGQTEQESAPKIQDLNKKTVDRLDESVSPKKTGNELKSEAGETDNRTATDYGDFAITKNPDVQNQEPARRRIVNSKLMKKNRSLFGNLLLAPFRAIAPALNSSLTKFENERQFNRLGIIFANPYVHPLIGNLGEGSGFGSGIFVSTADKLSRSYKLFASGHATFSGYTEIFAGIEAAPQNWAKGKLAFSTTGRYLLRPKEDYFGTGANSFRSNRTNYFRRESGARFDVSWRALRQLKFGAFTDFSHNSITDGKDKKVARITERFNQFDTPGLRRNVRLLDTGFYAEYEGRDEPENPHVGTYLRAAVSSTEGLGRDNDYSWLNYDFDARAYVPLGSKRRVLAFRLLGNFKDIKSNSTIPFFRLTKLGDSETLRGYESSRYQGLNALHLNVEYRFALMKGIKSEGVSTIEAILFTDLGQVFKRREELALENIKSSYGGGIQFASRQKATFSVLYAVSPEKSRLILRLGKIF